jgi:hypothetical protein
MVRMTTATDQLTRALLDIAARGERTHCSDPPHTICGLANTKLREPQPSCCATTAQSSTTAETQPRNAMNNGEFGGRSI